MIASSCRANPLPETIIAAGEQYLNRPLGGVITPYNSYVNRVYGVRDEEGNPYIMKFYRPGRWSKASILEEHTFLKECAAEEVPVVLPIPGRGGRTFDITAEEDWTRLGAIVGRMHMAGKKKNAEKRVVCSPEVTTVK